jgi:hypothetical protein
MSSFDVAATAAKLRDIESVDSGVRSKAFMLALMMPPGLGFVAAKTLIDRAETNLDPVSIDQPSPKTPAAAAEKPQEGNIAKASTAAAAAEKVAKSIADATQAAIDAAKAASVAATSAKQTTEAVQMLLVKIDKFLSANPPKSSS